LLDFAADPTLGPSSTNETYYYTDHLHLRLPGQAIVARIVAQAIAAKGC
jgi:lysophospholipase L1-like esterase